MSEIKGLKPEIYNPEISEEFKDIERMKPNLWLKKGEKNPEEFTGLGKYKMYWSAKNLISDVELLDLEMILDFQIYINATVDDGDGEKMHRLHQFEIPQEFQLKVILYFADGVRIVGDKKTNIYTLFVTE